MQLIRLTVEVTVSHKGWFEFRLCSDKRRYEELVTQECLNKHILQLENGSTRYDVPTFNPAFHFPVVKLPNDVTCEYCVLQW